MKVECRREGRAVDGGADSYVVVKTASGIAVVLPPLVGRMAEVVSLLHLLLLFLQSLHATTNCSFSTPYITTHPQQPFFS
jgi:hypothetical protein